MRTVHVDPDGRDAIGDVLDEIEAPQDDLYGLLSVDADGLTSRWDLADLIRDRYQLDVPSIDLLEELRARGIIIQNSSAGPW